MLDWVDAIVVVAMATTPRAGKMDCGGRREEEENYELRDVAEHGLGGWEEGGGGGFGVSSILQTAAAVDCRSIDRSN